MKANGMLCKLDALGRVVLPVEMRKNLEIASKDGLEIYVDDEFIILKKHEPRCVFCGETQGKIHEIKGKNICDSCLDDLHNM